MSEINKIDGSQPLSPKVEKTEKPVEEKANTEVTTEKPKETNLAASPSAVAGQSQVKKSTDNLEKDLAFGMKHEDSMEKSDRLFNIAFKALSANGDSHAYEKACAIATCDTSRELLNN